MYFHWKQKLQEEAFNLLNDGERPISVSWVYWHELVHLKTAEILRINVSDVSLRPGEVTYSEDSKNYGNVVSRIGDVIALFGPLYFFMKDNSKIGEELRKRINLGDVISEYKSFHWLLFDALLRE